MDRYTLQCDPDGYWAIYDQEHDGRGVEYYLSEARARRCHRLLNHLWNRRTR